MMAIWQVSSKQETGSDMELREFPSWWRAMLWAALNLKDCRIVVFVKIDE